MNNLDAMEREALWLNALHLAVFWKITPKPDAF